MSSISGPLCMNIKSTVTVQCRCSFNVKIQYDLQNLFNHGFTNLKQESIMSPPLPLSNDVIYETILRSQLLLDTYCICRPGSRDEFYNGTEMYNKQLHTTLEVPRRRTHLDAQCSNSAKV